MWWDSFGFLVCLGREELVRVGGLIQISYKQFFKIVVKFTFI